MIEILKACGQTEASKKLEPFNKSGGLIKLSYEPVIPVTKSRQEMKGTEIYEMNRSVRGKCLIINNHEKIFMESLRFESIFQQLHFEVELKMQLSTHQIKDRLIDLRKNIHPKSDALVVMIISHGKEESIIGFDKTLNKDDWNDKMSILEIVDMFSEEKCGKVLNGKPKLFFFTCCRESNDRMISFLIPSYLNS
jgi:hypothetical protein